MVSLLTKKWAYYNDNDPFVCAWVRELMKRDLIAPGEVDERSIEDVQPEDVRPFTQAHFFCGIAVWSYALRNAGRSQLEESQVTEERYCGICDSWYQLSSWEWADGRCPDCAEHVRNPPTRYRTLRSSRTAIHAGWPDSRPVWTGSCPCPSFSAAGQGKGFEDPRHLWPCWFGLIRESRPATIFGEQADKAIGFGWLDLIQTDLEAEGYAVGATVFGAHSVGAPHIRQRLYFVADARWQQDNQQGNRRQAEPSSDGPNDGIFSGGGQELCGPVAHAEREQLRASGSRSPESQAPGVQGENGKRKRVRHDVRKRSPVSIVGQSDCSGSQSRSEGCEVVGYGHTASATSVARRMAYAGNAERWPRPIGPYDDRTKETRRNESAGSIGECSPLGGFWRDAEWIYCRDEKWRPVEPGSFPLVNGTTNRVGRLRGYGNAINAEVAKGFIEAYMSL